MDQFVTKDLYISSFLHSSGCELQSHEQTNGITVFCLSRTPELDKLVESYFSLNASVNPIHYDEALKLLRNLAMGPKHREEKTLYSRVAM